MNETQIPISDDIRIELSEPSDNAQAVYTARQLSAQAGFCETDQFLIASAVSELATNIIRYAGEGIVTLKIIQFDHRVGIEIVAQDIGPGIADLDNAMKERFSSGNSLGLGLPSVKRIMDEFTITSKPGQGTVVRVHKWSKKPDL